MVRLFFLWLFTALLFLSCAEEKKTASLNFSFPKKSTTSTTAIPKQDPVTDAAPSQWYGSILEASEADCYGVFVGGPEDIQQRNHCQDKETGDIQIRFGNYYAALPGGDSVLEIELDAEVEREITIVAMGAQGGLCVDFAGLSPPPGQMTHPRVIHQQTYTFDSGAQNIDVVVPSSFGEINSELGDCQFDSTEQAEVDLAQKAVLSFLDPEGYDFGTTVIGTQRSHLVTIVNAGNRAAVDMSSVSFAAPFKFSGDTFPGANGTCGDSLETGQTCDLEVQYSPSVVNASDQTTLVVAYNDGTAVASIAKDFSGQAVNPASLSISESNPFTFDNTIVTQSKTHSFSVTNTGGYPAMSISLSPLTTPFTVVAGDCGSTLAPAAICTIDVAFSPATPGLFSDGISLAYNSGANAVTAQRSFQGTGLSPASISISEIDPYNFGNVIVGNSISHTFTITNVGGAPATSLDFTGLATPYFYDSGTCTTTLAAGASCDVIVDYIPVTTDPHLDSIIINYNDGNAGKSITRDLTGNGITPALLEINLGPTYDFGTVTIISPAIREFTITNNGGSTATGITDAFGLAAPYSFTGGTFPGGGSCGSSLAPSATCTFNVTFSPISVAVFSDTIEINYNDGQMGTATFRDVTGAGSN